MQVTNSMKARQIAIKLRPIGVLNGVKK